ncbi:unnamed protein product [Linum trigynum]|uniref:Uncharacterized protein n=1 Tax=Linum trigynum TaxID=586398 RepID=A0AAV2CG49_9ROSI
MLILLEEEPRKQAETCRRAVALHSPTDFLSGRDPSCPDLEFRARFFGCVGEAGGHGNGQKAIPCAIYSPPSGIPSSFFRRMGLIKTGGQGNRKKAIFLADLGFGGILIMEKRKRVSTSELFKGRVYWSFTGALVR